MEDSANDSEVKEEFKEAKQAANMSSSNIWQEEDVRSDASNMVSPRQNISQRHVLKQKNVSAQKTRKKGTNLFNSAGHRFVFEEQPRIN